MLKIENWDGLSYRELSTNPMYVEQLSEL